MTATSNPTSKAPPSALEPRRLLLGAVAVACLAVAAFFFVRSLNTPVGIAAVDDAQAPAPPAEAAPKVPGSPNKRLGP